MGITLFLIGGALMIYDYQSPVTTQVEYITTTDTESYGLPPVEELTTIMKITTTPTRRGTNLQNEVRYVLKEKGDA